MMSKYNTFTGLMEYTYEELIEMRQIMPLGSKYQYQYGTVPAPMPDPKADKDHPILYPETLKRIDQAKVDYPGHDKDIDDYVNENVMDSMRTFEPPVPVKTEGMDE